MSQRMRLRVRLVSQWEARLGEGWLETQARCKQGPSKAQEAEQGKGQGKSKQSKGQARHKRQSKARAKAGGREGKRSEAKPTLC